jgi:hypothetical protein
MSSPSTSTSLNTAGVTKKRRGTIDKGQISRPKLLPLGSGYGLVDRVDDPFFADQDPSSSARVHLPTFDPRSRGHKRSHTTPNAAPSLAHYDLLRSHTLANRLRATEEATQSLIRRQRNITATDEPIEGEEREKGLMLRIPAISVDKGELISTMQNKFAAYISISTTQNTDTEPQWTLKGFSGAHSR